MQNGGISQISILLVTPSRAKGPEEGQFGPSPRGKEARDVAGDFKRPETLDFRTTG